MCEHIQVLFKIGQQYIRAFLRAGVDGESQSTAKPLGESPWLRHRHAKATDPDNYDVTCTIRKGQRRVCQHFYATYKFILPETETSQKVGSF